jgi:formylglycine-generating enzyme required for sulfatase activity
MRTLYALAFSMMLWAGVSVAAHAAPAHEFRDCPNCPPMVSVPAGKFMMGASLAEEERQGMPVAQRGRSLPVHEVTIAQPFAMGEYPVTVAEFRAFVQETGYPIENSCTMQHRQDGHWVYERNRGYSWRDPGFPQKDDYPVVCVSWDDAQAYADWLSKKTGHHYTLPSEAQYEYALRAGTQTSFFWGDNRDATACLYSNQPDLDQAAALGNVPTGPAYRFQCHDGYGWTSPVNAYKPNPFGLHDMQGNIWEWVEDCANNNHEGAPADGSARLTGDCDGRMSKGGSYGNAAFSAYAGIRVFRDADYRGHSWGFRVARTDL